MRRRSPDEVQHEMKQLMQEHIDALAHQTFVTPTEVQLRITEQRLKRIREISAEYLLAMRESESSGLKGDSMTEKPSVILPGKVEKIIDSPDASEPQKAEIGIEGLTRFIVKSVLRTLSRTKTVTKFGSKKMTKWMSRLRLVTTARNRKTTAVSIAKRIAAHLDVTLFASGTSGEFLYRLITLAHRDAA